MPCDTSSVSKRTGKSAKSSRCEGKYAIVRTGKSASSSRCEGNCTIVRTCASAKLKRCTKSGNRRGRNKQTSSTNSPTGSRIWCCAPTSLLPQAKSLSLYLPVKASRPKAIHRGLAARRSWFLRGLSESRIITCLRRNLRPTTPTANIAGSANKADLHL